MWLILIEKASMFEMPYYVRLILCTKNNSAVFIIAYIDCIYFFIYIIMVIHV